MSWLPSFLNPWTALAAATAASALLLVLYFLKLRRREMLVSSTLLWKKAVQDLQVNAPFQRLRRNLLLFLQLLLLLLLSLALARPVVNYSPGAGSITVILIDRSASMSATDISGKSRLEDAKRQARELVDTLERNAQAMVIACDDAAETVQPFTTDVPALKNAIDSVQPTDRRSRLKLAYQLAEAQTAFIAEQNRPNAPPPDVWLYSDGKVLDANELRLRGNLKYVKVGTETAPNIAIVALSAKRNYERPTEVQVFARLANFGPEPTTADVQLSVDGRVSKLAATSLPPERWNDPNWVKANPGKKDESYVARDSVEFTIELTTSAVIRVEQMNKEKDCLAADDEAQVVVPPPRSLAVLLVTDGNYFLEKAIHSMGLKAPDSLLPTVYEEKLPTQYDVVIFDRYKPQKLPGAGNFIYFGAVPDGLKLKAAKEQDRNVLLKDVQVLDWKRDHPILRYLSLGRINIAEAIKLEVPLESEVLMDGMQGPLIVLHREGRSTHLVVAFNVLESDWPLKVSFPIFLQNALQFLAIGSDMDVRESYEPGSTPRILRANLQRLSPPPTEIKLSGPLFRKVSVPEAGDVALPALDKVGTYTLDPPVPQHEKIAVNLLDPNESDLIPSSSAPGNLGEAIARTGGKSRLELWWWIVACAALPLLFIEWWVYTRRVHL